MFKKENPVFLGTLLKPHGIHGDLVFKLNSLHSEDIPEIESLFAEIDGLLVPFFVSHFSEINESSLLIRFDDIDSIVKAKKLAGCKIFIPSGILVMPDNIYSKSTDLIGYGIMDSKHGNLGKITDIINITDNPLLKVRADDNEYMIPFHHNIIRDIDDNIKTVFTEIPDGLLDL